MRVFSLGPDGEFESVPFETDHEESVLEGWLESNLGGILEDGPLLIIGRQVPTDLGKSIRFCSHFISISHPKAMHLHESPTVEAYIA